MGEVRLDMFVWNENYMRNILVVYKERVGRILTDRHRFIVRVCFFILVELYKSILFKTWLTKTVRYRQAYIIYHLLSRICRQENVVKNMPPRIMSSRICRQGYSIKNIVPRKFRQVPRKLKNTDHNHTGISPVFAP